MGVPMSRFYAKDFPPLETLSNFDGWLAWFAGVLLVLLLCYMIKIAVKGL